MGEPERAPIPASEPIYVTMPAIWLWLFRLGTPIVGAGLGLVARPVLEWVLGLVGAAPALLRAAGSMSPVVAVLVLAVLGGGVGAWLAHEAESDSLHLTVGPDGLALRQAGAERFVARDRIAQVFLDRNDLVTLDPSGRQVSRNGASDLDLDAVEHALQVHGYPWKGRHDPHETDFTRWVEDHPALESSAHDLLRARSRALDDERKGAVAELDDRLRDAGYVVRDRGGAQEWRRIRPEVGSG